MTNAGIELRCPDRVGAQRFDLRRESFVQPLDDRNHEDNRDHADTDAENRQRRPQLVAAHGVKRHQGGFAYVDKSHFFNWTAGHPCPHEHDSAKNASSHCRGLPLLTPKPRAAETPVASRFAQPSSYRITFDVVDRVFEMFRISNVTIEVVFKPKAAS